MNFIQILKTIMNTLGSIITTGNQKTIEFFKENNKWYADLPGDQEENEMMEGADTLLQYLSEGHDRINLVVSTTKDSENPLHLTRIEHTDCGATYMLGSDPKDTVWLCNVVHTVFKDHPKHLYIINYNILK